MSLDDTESVDCDEWLQPEIPLRDLPRIKLDKAALASAAADIAREMPGAVRDVLANPATDSRLLPHLRLAVALRERKAS